MSFSVGRVITFLDHMRGRVTVFSAENWGRAYKNCTWQKKIAPALPPPLINDRSLSCIYNQRSECNILRNIHTFRFFHATDFGKSLELCLTSCLHYHNILSGFFKSKLYHRHFYAMSFPVLNHLVHHKSPISLYITVSLTQKTSL